MSTETRAPFRYLLHNARAYIRSQRVPSGTLDTVPRQYRGTARIDCLMGLQGYSTERRLAHLNALEQLTRLASTRRQTHRFYDELLDRLAARRRRHGHAYVTPAEGQWLTRNGLRQPGHTRYRYSTPGEDLSDAAQLGPDPEA